MRHCKCSSNHHKHKFGSVKGTHPLALRSRNGLGAMQDRTLLFKKGPVQVEDGTVLQQPRPQSEPCLSKRPNDSRKVGGFNPHLRCFPPRFFGSRPLIILALNLQHSLLLDLALLSSTSHLLGRTPTVVRAGVWVRVPSTPLFGQGTWLSQVFLFFTCFSPCSSTGAL